MSILPARGGIGASCEVRTGSLRDAILHAVGANATHGLRRSNADKRRAVAILLEDPLVSADPETGAPLSNREIARLFAVDETLVRSLRPAPASAVEPQIETARTVSRGGTVYEMQTASIDRKPGEASAFGAAPPRAETAMSGSTQNSPLDPRLFQ